RCSRMVPGRLLLAVGRLQMLFILRPVVCWDDNSLDESGALRPSMGTDEGSADGPVLLHGLTKLNMSVQLGSTAYLHCHVTGLKDQQVSWYRRKDKEIHLITFGFQNYHNDDRFSLTYEQPNDWRLRIRYVQHRDEGTYECQVSSHPPIIRTIHLHVVVPRIEIMDDRGEQIKEKFYHSGSTIELQCQVSDVPTATTLQLGWYRGTQRLNYDASRGGVSVKTELRGSVAKSWLRVGDATLADSGTYYCNITELTAIGVNIHVVPDEYPAAIQSGSLQRASLNLIVVMVALSIINTCCTTIFNTHNSFKEVLNLRPRPFR
ncbi:unnamed protein product, partial [Meganyctiphanes norvegica]